MSERALAATTQATVGVITGHTTGCACDTCDQLRYVRLPDAVERLVEQAAEAARLRAVVGRVRSMRDVATDGKVTVAALDWALNGGDQPCC
jgi:DNA-binding phage protein